MILPVMVTLKPVTWPSCVRVPLKFSRVTLVELFSRVRSTCSVEKRIGFSGGVGGRGSSLPQEWQEITTNNTPTRAKSLNILFMIDMFFLFYIGGSQTLETKRSPESDWKLTSISHRSIHNGSPSQIWGQRVMSLHSLQGE